jgi:hypothetical protein
MSLNLRSAVKNGRTFVFPGHGSRHARSCPYPVPGSPRQPPHEERQVQSAPPERQPFDEEVRGGGGATVTIFLCSPGGSIDPFDFFWVLLSYLEKIISNGFRKRSLTLTVKDVT